MALPRDAPDWWTYEDYIRLIDTINTIGVIGAITNILNVESVDLIDRITLIDDITDVGTINLINTIASITNILNVDSVDLIDRITLIDDIFNIANIQSVDLIDLITRIALIDRITLIDEITKIGEIATIRDVTSAPPSFIVNPSFEQDFTGWTVVDDWTIATDQVHLGSHSAKILALHHGILNQTFGIPLGVDWMQGFYIFMRSSNLAFAVDVTYFYADDTTTTQTLSATVANNWERHTLTPTAGKYIAAITWRHLGGYNNTVWIDSILTVF